MQEIVNGLALAAIYTMFGIGLSLSWGALKVLNLAHGAIFMSASFVAYLVADSVDVGLFTVAVICVAVGGVLTLLAELLVFTPIRARTRDHHQAEFRILIAGIGLATMLVTVAEQLTHNTPFGFRRLTYETVVWRWGDVRVSNTNLLVVTCAVVVVGAIAAWLRWAPSGRATRALANDEETAALMGVNRLPLRLGVMFVSGGLAGLAAALLTVNLGALSPDSGENLLVKGFAVVILGGVGSISGTLLGAAILAATEVAVVTVTDGGFTDAVTFAFMILVILLRPQGLLGQPAVDRV